MTDDNLPRELRDVDDAPRRLRPAWQRYVAAAVAAAVVLALVVSTVMLYL